MIKIKKYSTPQPEKTKGATARVFTVVDENGCQIMLDVHGLEPHQRVLFAIALIDILQEVIADHADEESF